MAGLLYLDASAIVKLIVEEPESAALRGALRARPDRVSSALSQVEVRLAAGRREPSPPAERVAAALAGLTLIAIDQPVLDLAGELGEQCVRTLDAIHLATALTLADDLDALIAYDRRLLAAAVATGLRTERPD